jgi:hypothetical protein
LNSTTASRAREKSKLAPKQRATRTECPRAERINSSPLNKRLSLCGCNAVNLQVSSDLQRSGNIRSSKLFFTTCRCKLTTVPPHPFLLKIPTSPSRDDTWTLRSGVPRQQFLRFSLASLTLVRLPRRDGRRGANRA